MLNVGAGGAASPSSAARTSDVVMTRVRPIASLSHAAGSRPIPTPAVVTASVSADAPGETPKSSRGRQQRLGRVEEGEGAEAGGEEGDGDAAEAGGPA